MKALPLTIIVSLFLSTYIFLASKKADREKNIKVHRNINRVLFLLTFILCGIGIFISLQSLGQYYVYTDEKVRVTTQQLVGFSLDGEEKFVLEERVGAKDELTFYMYDDWNTVTERHIDLTASTRRVEIIYDETSVPQYETYGIASRNRTGKPLLEWIFPMFPSEVRNFSYVIRLPKSAFVTIEYSR